MPHGTKKRSGSYTERQRRKFQASEAEAVREERVSPQRWPEIRIVRQVLYAANDIDQVDRFINDLGHRNIGVGEAKALGSQAMTIVDAQSMGRMLAKKHRKAYSDRKKTLQIQRSFARDFNQFVRSQERTREEVRFEKKTAAKLCTSGVVNIESGVFIPPPKVDLSDEFPEIFISDEFDDLPEKTPQDIDEMRWNSGSFAVKNCFSVYGNGEGLGFDLSDVDQFAKEYEETEKFLKASGLDTKHMLDPETREPRFSPHIMAFRTFEPAGRVALSHVVEFPQLIPLSAPAAVVNPNHINLV